jgi:hypothetical protein
MKDVTLYHYCSNSSFLSIIATSTIWASEFTLSNDHLEGKWIRNVIEATCIERQLASPYTSAVLQRADSMIAFLGGTGICLSEEGDLLSQWRAYSENGCGLSIGFDRQHFGNADSGLPSLFQVEYDLERQKAAIAATMDCIVSLAKDGLYPPSLISKSGNPEMEKDYERKSKEIDVHMFSLFPYLYTFKNPAFREEREWRSVSPVIGPTKFGNMVAQDAGSGLLMHRMEFRALSDRLVPYTPINLTKSAITDVVIGPRNITPIRVVESALYRHGFNNVCVRRSEASYR